MFYIEPNTAAELGITLFEHNKRVTTLLKKLRYLLRHGILHVEIFGPGGVGKTTLGLILAEGTHPKRSTNKYQESIDVEGYWLQGDTVVAIHVPPGQERRRSSTWQDFYKRLAQGKSSGVINVVSWGYHSFQEFSYQETKYYRKGMSETEFLANYAEQGREEELTIIKDLVPRLCDAKEKLWMITLVTKQDLWWNERASVRQHYEQGEYHSYINKILEAKGSQNFSHEYLSASLVLNNLTSGTGQLLAPTTAGYDQNIQAANVEQFLKAINSFAER